MNNGQTMLRREHEFRILDLVYDNFKVGDEKRTNIGELAIAMDFSASIVSAAFEGFREADIVVLRRAYEAAEGTNGGPRSVIRSFFTVLVPKEVAIRKFTAYWDRLLKRRAMEAAPPRPARPEPIARPAPVLAHSVPVSAIEAPVTRRISEIAMIPAVAITMADIPAPSPHHPDVPKGRSAPKLVVGRVSVVGNSDEQIARVAAQIRDEDLPSVVLAHNDAEVVRAVSGPERPTLGGGNDEGARVLRALRRNDDAEAAVAAARQYNKRFDAIEATIKTLEAAGVIVHRTAFIDSLNLPSDAFMEAISKIVPFIDRLETTVERLAAQNMELRRRVADHDQLKRDYEAGRRVNERLVAERTERNARSDN